MLQGKEASTQSRRCRTASVRRLRVQRFAPKTRIVFPGLLVTKKCFERIGQLDENIVFYQEWDTSIRLAKYCRFGFVPEPNFFYDCRYTEAISKDSLREAKGYEQVFTKHFWSIFGLLGARLWSGITK